MASDESMTIRSCISMQEDEYDDDTDDGYDHQLPHPHSLSRLSTCSRSRSSMYGADQNQDIDHDDPIPNYYYQGGQEDQPLQEESGMSMYMSLLSMESFDGDIDEETLSSNAIRGKQVLLAAGLSSDSDKEPGCYSLPATPPRRRTAQAAAPGRILHFKHPHNPTLVKEYASENEAHTAMTQGSKRSTRRRSRRRIMKNRHSWLSASPDRETLALAKKKDDGDDDNKENMSTYMMRMGSTSSNQLGHCHSFSGESEGTGTGPVVITRPKGGRRSLCMDLEEVKACRDLGFELEHQHMLQEMPSRLSLSASTLDTNTTCSSGGNSPIANWRISSPGDDPREVKARLKVWAQAVALASTSRPGS